MILSVHEIQKTFDGIEILKNVSFHIEAHEKMALIGQNGAGKTTLFHILLGEYPADRGTVQIQRGLQIGYLPQQIEVTSSARIEEELLTVFEPLQQMENKMRRLELEMKNDTSAALMEQYARLTENFERNDGYSYHSKVRGVLTGLGFTESEFELPISCLSGGQKARVALSKLLLQKPDLLLLDEPTNHLDIEAISWLEDYLQSYTGAAIIISHDRYFLDKICTHTVEIENGVSEDYPGGYTWYAREKEKRTRQRMKEYEAQQAEIHRQEEIIARLRSYGREKFIKRAQSREKILDKMELITKPITYDEAMHFSLEPKIVSGNDVLTAHEVAKSFEGKPLFEHMSFLIQRGERIALLGANGTGKTTLFRMILKKESHFSGQILPGVKVFPAYYDQELQNLSPEKTILDEIYDAYPDMNLGEIRNVLASFLFRGEDVFKPISTLSGGEKARVSICKIMLSQSNFLLLDEPTNHLDALSREVLENNLRNYKGTLFFISHDRYFINRVATAVFILTPQGIQRYSGNYEDYINENARRKAEADASVSAASSASASKNPSSHAAAPASAEAVNISPEKDDWLSRKQSAAELRKMRAHLRNLELEIAQCEQELSDLGEQMLSPEIYSDSMAYKQLEDEQAAKEEHLNHLYEEWDRLSENV